MREWLIGIGIVLILAVILDGVRRMRQARRDAIKMSLSMQQGSSSASSEDLPSYGSDLPSGGARVVGRRDPDSAKNINSRVREAAEQNRPLMGKPEQTSLDLETSVPLLMDTVDLLPAENEPALGEASTLDELEKPVDEGYDFSSALDKVAEEANLNLWAEQEKSEMKSQASMDLSQKSSTMDASTLDTSALDGSKRGSSIPQARETESPVFESSVFESPELESKIENRSNNLNDSQIEPEPESRELYQVVRVSKTRSTKPSKAGSIGSRKSVDSFEKHNNSRETNIAVNLEANPLSTAKELIVINVMARQDRRFLGTDLMDVLLAQGLRYGAMKIFHRHQKLNGEGPYWFSIANIVEPGTFDLAKMNQFSTPGICLMLPLPCDDEAIKAFDAMVKVATNFSQQLGGELKDERRSVMTKQTLEHCRVRIQDFLRKQLTKTH